MAKKKQNINLTGPLSWNAIKVYLGGDLSDKEMYNLERKIQNEAFEQEAFDGFYDHAPASMETDLDALREKIARKTGNRLHVKKTIPFVVNWTLVAAIAALVIIVPVAIYFFAKSDNQEVQLAQSIEPAVDTGDTDKGALSGYAPEIVVDDSSIEEEEDVPAVVEAVSKRKIVKQVAEQIISDDLELEELASVPGRVQSFEAKDLEKNTSSINKKINSMGASSVAENIAVESVDADSLVNSSMLDLGATPKLKGRSELDKREILSRTPALAPGGLEGYKVYLKSQLLSSYRNLEGEYKIRLVVSARGEIEDVEIIEGLSRRADRKLVKIIKEAPVWTPANEKGEKVSDIASFSLSLN